MADLTLAIKGSDSSGDAVSTATTSLESLNETAQTTSETSSGLASIFSGALSVATGEILVEAFNSAAESVGEFFTAATKVEDITTRMDFQIDKLGDSAAISKQGALDLADSLKALTGGSDDVALSLESNLLKFDKIGKDVFPDAAKASADLGAAMGIPADKAAQLLGRMLDTGAGLTRLTAVGVTFTAQEQDQIKAFYAAGDAADAQRIILGKLNDKVGGEAVVMSHTLSGEMDILKNSFENAGSQVLEKFLPVIEDVFNKVIEPNIPVILEMSQTFADNLVPALTFLSDLFNDIVSEGGDLGVFFDDLNETIPGLAANFGLVEDAILSFQRDGIGGLQQTIGPALGQIGSTILTQLGVWGQAFIAWVQPMIPPLLLELGKLEIQAFQWVVAQVPGWITQLEQWGIQLWQWVAPMIPPLLAEGQKLFGQLMGWVAAQIPPLTAQLLLWGQEFVAWVGPQIPPLLSELGLLLGQLVGWVWGTAVPAIITAVGDWAKAFGDWVMKPGGAKDQILPALASFLLEVGKFVDTSLVPGFIGFAKSFIDGLLSGFNTNLPTLVNNVEDMGKAIIGGIVSGIEAAPGAVLTALQGVVNGAISQIKHDLGISSPSKVFAGIGENMMSGLTQGITGPAGQSAQAAMSAATSPTSIVNKNFYLNSQVTPVTGTIDGDFGVMQAMERAFA